MKTDHLAEANSLIAYARVDAGEYIANVRRLRNKFEKDGFVLPTAGGPADLVKAQTEWNAKLDSLRHVERTFKHSEFMSDRLDVATSKPLLDAIGEQLEAMLRAYRKHLIDEVPKETNQDFDELQSIPPPDGGLFGRTVETPLPEALAAFRSEVERFPDARGFSGLVSIANALRGRMLPPDPKRALAKRMDRPVEAWR